MILKSKKLRKYLASLILGTGLLGWALPAFAGPGLYWWHLPLSVSRSECIRRAEGALISERVPVRRKTSDAVTGWHDDVTTEIKCLIHKGELLAIIIVTSQDGNFARHLMVQFKETMHTGAVFEN